MDSGRAARHEPQYDLSALAPVGWTIRRHGKRRWWLYRDTRAVADFGVLYTGEWWVLPNSETLPWARTYHTAAEAVDALVAWWRVTRG